MYEEFISKRITQLREAKGVSAREMSLDIGQNSSYINRIENEKAMPSIQGLLYICEYLGVTPAEFFSDNRDPVQLKNLISEIESLSSNQIRILGDIVADLKKLSKA